MRIKKNIILVLVLLLNTSCLHFNANKRSQAFQGPYDLKAYNDEKRIGFNHVYKELVQDNLIDKSLSDDTNLKGQITVYIPKKEGKYPLILITHG